MGCSPSSCICERTAPRAKSEASVSKTTGKEGTKVANTGAAIKARFNKLKVCSHADVQVKGIPFYSKIYLHFLGDQCSRTIAKRRDGYGRLDCDPLHG